MTDFSINKNDGADKMKFLVERIVDGQTKFSVVEAETPMLAMHEDMAESFFTDEQRMKEIRESNVVSVGVYEIGQVNHLVAINKEFELHRFYNKG